MTFAGLINDEQSKKISIVEIDTPLQDLPWINYQPGIWFTRITPGSGLVSDDNGNTGYWGTGNDQKYNIESLNVDGSLYNEADTLLDCISTEQTWYYDSSTTDFYIHFDEWHTPLYYQIVAPGAVIGFTLGEDKIQNNYFEDIGYEPLVTAIPNLSKKKDPLFYGLIEYSGGTVTFDNTGGYFDDFASRDLYGQPVRIKLTFEGLPFSEQQLVYSGKVEDFEHDFTSFKLIVADSRKTLSRDLPINSLSLDDYPDMKESFDGTAIPIAFGTIINAPAYKVTDTEAIETFVFYDDTYISVDSGITVVDSDGEAVTVTQSGGTFTTTNTDNTLYVSFSQSTVQNGLDVISSILSDYENIEYNDFNYETTEWSSAVGDVSDTGLWIGKGNVLTSSDVIEQICADNQGIFEVLPDGRFTFRFYEPTRLPTFEVNEWELLEDPTITRDSDEYLTSVTVEHSYDWLDKEYVTYSDTSLETNVYARYRTYQTESYETALTNSTDAGTLAAAIMEQSQYILPTVTITTKTQNINMRVLDNVLYECVRQNGSVVIPRSSYQVLGITLDLSSYEMKIIMRQIEENDNMYMILDGGDSTTSYDYYDSGDSSTDYDYVDGGGA